MVADQIGAALRVELPALFAQRFALVHQVEAIDRDILQRLALSSPDPGIAAEIRAEHSEPAAPDLVSCVGPCGRLFPRPIFKTRGQYWCPTCRYAPDGPPPLRRYGQ